MLWFGNHSFSANVGLARGGPEFHPQVSMKVSMHLSQAQAFRTSCQKSLKGIKIIRFRQTWGGALAIGGTPNQKRQKKAKALVFGKSPRFRQNTSHQKSSVLMTFDEDARDLCRSCTRPERKLQGAIQYHSKQSNIIHNLTFNAFCGSSVFQDVRVSYASEYSE